MNFSLKNKKGEESKIFLPKMELDTETMKQVRSLIDNPSLNHIRFMPDVHKGMGCCVGLTSIIKDSLVPNLVGGDIGCGISCYPLGKIIKEKSFERIERVIKNVIPMGKNNINSENVSEDNEWEELYTLCNYFYDKLIKLPEFEAYKHRNIYYDKHWFQDFIKRINSNLVNDINSLGSLGSGNHYIEININSENMAYITVHSGSRNLGQKVCNYHQKILNEQCKIDLNNFHKKCDKIPKKIKGEERRKLEDEIYKQFKDKVGVKWLEDEKMFDYLVDMIFTQHFASLNRKVMLRRICEFNDFDYDKDNIIETVHNYIDFNHNELYLRKGAVSAQEGELCIVSLNMRDGVLLCKGKGNPDWNYSSAHGSGRILNRGSASRLSMKQFKREMENVYSTSVNKLTLDESPMAYRDTELVKMCLEDSVDIIEQLKPIINCKGI